MLTFDDTNLVKKKVISNKIVFLKGYGSSFLPDEERKVWPSFFWLTLSLSAVTTEYRSRSWANRVDVHAYYSDQHAGDTPTTCTLFQFYFAFQLCLLHKSYFKHTKNELITNECWKKLTHFKAAALSSLTMYFEVGLV